MSRSCTICVHDHRRDIEVELVKRIAYRDIARRFSVSKDALSRHTKEHLPERVRKAAEAADERAALDVLKELKAINSTSFSILKKAKENGNLDLALKAIDRVQRQIELQAKLLGDLDDRPQVNLYLSPEWLQLRALIITALEPYSEARESVVKALEAASNGRA